MSEIFKAKNRIMNRTKSNISQQQLNLELNDPQNSNPCNIPFNQETFDLEPVTTAYKKKFNISSISMKFAKFDQPQQTHSYTPQKYQVPKINLPQQPINSAQKQNSPQFSRTERINPIRHFEPYNLNTLSESNSNSNLSNRWTRAKSRKLVTTQSQNFEFQDKRSNVKMMIQKKQASPLANESPIRKIKKTVHLAQSRLLIAKEEKKRAQSPYKPKQCLKDYVQNKINQLAQKRKNKFYDDQFPAGFTIVFPRKSLYEEEPQLSFEPISKLYQEKEVQVVLLQSCQPTIISPGQFTNPYVYSAIRILAQYPEKILSLFENQQLNEQGIYYIRLCKDGTWRYIIIDDLVPVRLYEQNKRKKKQILGLSCSVGDANVEMWAALIEKALAKVYGTYYDLFLSRRDGICPIFRMLTGFPVSKYDLIKDVRSYLVLIDSALKRHQIVILQQILPQFQRLAQLKGLSRDQSYQLIEIQKNFFVLRNLSDFDLVTKLSFDEVMMFSSLLIFRKEENYVYVSQKLRHKKGFFSLLKVSVPVNTQCYWDVWQNNPAYYKNHLQNKIQYEVAPFKIVIQPLSVESLPTTYDSVQQSEAILQSGKQIMMKKGQYLVEVHLCQSMQEMDFTLSYYGQKDVQLQRVKNQNEKWIQKCSCHQEVIKKQKYDETYLKYTPK